MKILVFILTLSLNLNVYSGADCIELENSIIEQEQLLTNLKNEVEDMTKSITDLQFVLDEAYKMRAKHLSGTSLTVTIGAGMVTIALGVLTARMKMKSRLDGWTAMEKQFIQLQLKKEALFMGIVTLGAAAYTGYRLYPIFVSQKTMIEAQNDIKLIQNDLDVLKDKIIKKEELLIKSKDTFMELCY